MEVEVRQRIGKDKYILFEHNKNVYDITPFENLSGKYVYATRSEKDSLDLYIWRVITLSLRKGVINI